MFRSNVVVSVTVQIIENYQCGREYPNNLLQKEKIGK